MYNTWYQIKFETESFDQNDKGERLFTNLKGKILYQQDFESYPQ